MTFAIKGVGGCLPKVFFEMFFLLNILVYHTPPIALIIICLLSTIIVNPPAPLINVVQCLQCYFTPQLGP